MGAGPPVGAEGRSLVYLWRCFPVASEPPWDVGNKSWTQTGAGAFLSRPSPSQAAATPPPISQEGEGPLEGGGSTWGVLLPGRGDLGLENLHSAGAPLLLLALAWLCRLGSAGLPSLPGKQGAGWASGNKQTAPNPGRGGQFQGPPPKTLTPVSFRGGGDCRPPSLPGSFCFQARLSAPPSPRP